MPTTRHAGHGKLHGTLASARGDLRRPAERGAVPRAAASLGAGPVPRLWLRAGRAAAARVHGFAAHRHRCRPRPAHPEAGRSALGPAARPARRHHAAGGPHRCTHAESRRRGPAVLRGQRAARAARCIRWPLASRSMSVPNCTATSRWRPTSRCSSSRSVRWPWRRSSICASTSVTRASCAPCSRSIRRRSDLPRTSSPR